MVVRAHDLKVHPHILQNLHYAENDYLQAVNFQHLKKQEKFLATPMGKGILLLSLSLIKYRFVVTHLLYIYISTQHQLRWDQCVFLSEAAYFSWYSVMKANYRKV